MIAVFIRTFKSCRHLRSASLGSYVEGIRSVRIKYIRLKKYYNLPTVGSELDPCRRLTAVTMLHLVYPKVFSLTYLIFLKAGLFL